VEEIGGIFGITARQNFTADRNQESAASNWMSNWQLAGETKTLPLIHGKPGQVI